MTRAFAFTGIPGTGVQQVMRRLAKALDEETTHVFCLDEYLWKAFCATARADQALLEATGLLPEAVEEGLPPDWW